MKRQKSSVMKNHSIICQHFLRLKVIHQSSFPEGVQTDQFLFSASIYLGLKGYEFIETNYKDSVMIIHETNSDESISFFNLEKSD